MKKIFIVIIALLVFQITGCSNSSSTTIQENNETVEDTAKITFPAKGQNIIIESNNFKIIKINDDGIAVIMLNEIYGDKCEFASNNVYQDSNVDQLCQKFYDSLSDNVKKAIIEQEINVYEYELDFSEEKDNHPVNYKYSSKKLIANLKRNAYVLDIEDIEEYFNNSFTSNDIKELFNNREMDFPWLRSGCTGYADSIWGLNPQSGTIMSYAIFNSSGVRPACTIDLCKTDYVTAD